VTQQKNITSKEFQELYQKNPHQWEIIDVRELWEVDVVSIKNAKHWPLSQMMRGLQGSQEDVNWNNKVAFICRSGGRSMQAMIACTKQQGGELYNIIGGVEELFKISSTLLELHGNERDIKNYLE